MNFKINVKEYTNFDTNTLNKLNKLTNEYDPNSNILNVNIPTSTIAPATTIGMQLQYQIVNFPYYFEFPSTYSTLSSSDWKSSSVMHWGELECKCGLSLSGVWGDNGTGKNYDHMQECKWDCCNKSHGSFEETGICPGLTLLNEKYHLWLLALNIKYITPVPPYDFVLLKIYINKILHTFKIYGHDCANCIKDEFVFNINKNDTLQIKLCKSEVTRGNKMAIKKNSFIRLIPIKKLL